MPDPAARNTEPAYENALRMIAETAEMWLSHDMWPEGTTERERVAADARALVVRDYARSVLARAAADEQENTDA